MKARNAVILLAVVLLITAGAAVGFAYVHSTILQYQDGVPCGLTGVPRLLQVTNFTGPSQCKPPGQDGKCNNAACDMRNPPSGKALKGHCELVANACVCVKDK